MICWFKTGIHIRDEETRIMSEALKINSTLTSLNLSCNRKKKMKQEMKGEM